MNDQDDSRSNDQPPTPPGDQPPTPTAAAGPIKKQAQPCPAQCGGTILVPEAFPNYVQNHPHVSLVVVVHEHPIRCSNCRAWWTIGIRNDQPINLAFMPAPPPPDQPQVEVVKPGELPANIPPGLLRMIKGGKGH